jgi:hypothetical protein
MRISILPLHDNIQAIEEFDVTYQTDFLQSLLLALLWTLVFPQPWLEPQQVDYLRRV